MTGGDLFSYIEHKAGCIEDEEACSIVHQVLKGLQYLHGRGITHRDLKPDNVLMTSSNSHAKVVLTDFGAAIKQPPGTKSRRERMMTFVGTTDFRAP